MTIVAVDVDLTVVDTLTPWLDWFKFHTGYEVQNENGEYDLVPEMKLLIEKSKMGGKAFFDPFNFWKDSHLYDSLDPIPLCSRQLLKLKEETGCKIIFVSSCVPEHTKSKLRFLEDNFEFDAFIATHDKHFVGYDVLIDDKLYHMQEGMRYRPDAKHIMFTGIRADGRPEDREDIDIMSCWSQLPAKLGF